MDEILLGLLILGLLALSDTNLLQRISIYVRNLIQNMER
jgi:hypothetical protein